MSCRVDVVARDQHRLMLAEEKLPFDCSFLDKEAQLAKCEEFLRNAHPEVRKRWLEIELLQAQIDRMPRFY